MQDQVSRAYTAHLKSYIESPLTLSMYFYLESGVKGHFPGVQVPISPSVSQYAILFWGTNFETRILFGVGVWTGETLSFHTRIESETQSPC